MAGGRRRVIDLHGFDSLTAMELARVRVAEAWSNGYREVELVHGAPEVESPRAGRGKIKFGLRQMVADGDFDGYADRSAHWLKAGSIVMKLKANPSPRPERWSPDPPRRR